jgi:hypothetical protein
MSLANAPGPHVFVVALRIPFVDLAVQRGAVQISSIPIALKLNKLMTVISGDLAHPGVMMAVVVLPAELDWIW